MNLQNKPNDIVKLRSVTKTFDCSNKTYGIKEVSINIIPNEVLLLLGPSGSGKTTLLKLMSGLIQPSNGSILLFSKNINSYSKKDMQTIRARNIGFVFQTFNLIDQLSVLENIVMVLRFAKNNSGHYKKEALRLLGNFKIDHLAKKMPNKLSQGE